MSSSSKPTATDNLLSAYVKPREILNALPILTRSQAEANLGLTIVDTYILRRRVDGASYKYRLTLKGIDNKPLHMAFDVRQDGVYIHPSRIARCSTAPREIDSLRGKTISMQALCDGLANYSESVVQSPIAPDVEEALGRGSERVAVIAILTYVTRYGARCITRLAHLQRDDLVKEHSNLRGALVLAWTAIGGEQAKRALQEMQGGESDPLVLEECTAALAYLNNPSTDGSQVSFGFELNEKGVSEWLQDRANRRAIAESKQRQALAARQKQEKEAAASALKDIETSDGMNTLMAACKQLSPPAFLKLTELVHSVFTDGMSSLRDEGRFVMVILKLDTHYDATDRGQIIRSSTGKLIMLKDGQLQSMGGEDTVFSDGLSAGFVSDLIDVHGTQEKARHVLENGITQALQLVNKSI